MWTKALLAWLLWLSGIGTAEALTCEQVSGFSSFSCVVDQTAKTIALTETINAAEAIVKFTWSGDDWSYNWVITKTVTNGTDVQWLNVDNELWPRCNEACSEGPTVDEYDTCASNVGGTVAYCHSDDFDGLSFSQGTPTRVFNSTAFCGNLVDEFTDRDFVRFYDCDGSCGTPCVPAGCSGACCTHCGTANQVPVSGSDTETFWMFNFNTTYTETQLVQTPNFGLAPSCYVMESIASNFEDISGTGTASGSCLNRAIGFTFNLWGDDITTVRPRFGTINDQDCPSITNFDLSAPGSNLFIDAALIAPWWDDWTGGGTVYRQTLGTTPNQRFIFQWEDTCHFDQACSGDNLVTFQVKIFETSNIIEFHYQDVLTGAGVDSSDGGTISQGGSGTVGIVDVGGPAACTTPADPEGCQFSCLVDQVPAGCGRYRQFSFLTQSLTNSTAIRFTPTLVSSGTCPIDDDGAFGWSHRP